jgi:hypothetical protein
MSTPATLPAYRRMSRNGSPVRTTRSGGGKANPATCLLAAVTTTRIGRVYLGFRRAQTGLSTSTQPRTQRNSAGIRVGLLTATVRLANSIRLALESRRQVFARRWLRSASLGSR